MSEIRHSEIVYEEGWRDAAPVAQTEIPLDEMPGDQKPYEPQEGSKPLLITIQLVLSLLAALILFLLKAMDSVGYHDFMAYYHEELSKPIVSQGVFEALDLQELFTQNSVTVNSTPDEAQDR